MVTSHFLITKITDTGIPQNKLGPDTQKRVSGPNYFSNFLFEVDGDLVDLAGELAAFGVIALGNRGFHVDTDAGCLIYRPKASAARHQRGIYKTVKKTGLIWWF